MTITKANANVGRTIKVVASIGHCLPLNSIGIIEESIYPEGHEWVQVRGQTEDGVDVVQLLDKDDYVFAD